MTPRQVRERIEEIDQELKKLVRWEKTLVAARRRLLLEDTSSARWTVEIIENGRRPGEGLPPDPELAPFSEGFQGLHDTRSEIAHLKEKRALLVRRRPSKAETATKKKEAEDRAADIRTRSEDLAIRAESTHAMIKEAARLALAVAKDARRLWEDNVVLDKLTTDSDIARPKTPVSEAATFPAALPLSILLRNYFRGGQPSYLEPKLADEIRTALAGSKSEPIV
jgi:hypothetical protein